MRYRSVFVFEQGNAWARDWSQSDFVDHPPSSAFTRLDLPYGGSAPTSRWSGTANVLTVVRDDSEQLHDLVHLLNTPPLGGPSGSIWQRLVKEAEVASHRLPPLVNVLFQPPIRFSYAYGEHAVGPGKEHGGLRTVPERYHHQPILTIKVPLHINTPPGMSSVDAELVFYVGLRATGGHVAAELLGAAHPWRFHGDGYGAYQNEINAGLSTAAQQSLAELRPLVDLLHSYRASQVYLVPGAGTPKLEDGHAVRSSARTHVTLALVP